MHSRAQCCGWDGPSFTRIHYVVGRGLDWLAALRCGCGFSERGATRFGDYFQLHYDLGLAYYLTNKIAEAQGEFEEAVRLSPNFDRAELLIAGCLIAKGDSSKAADLQRKMVKEHPDNAVYWGTLGRTLGQMGGENNSEAVRACRRALALQPNDPHLQFDAGTVFTETGNFAAARPLLEHLEQSHPEILAVHVQLARVYSRLGQRELREKKPKS